MKNKAFILRDDGRFEQIEVEGLPMQYAIHEYEPADANPPISVRRVALARTIIKSGAGERILIYAREGADVLRAAREMSPNAATFALD